MLNVKVMAPACFQMGGSGRVAAIQKVRVLPVQQIRQT